jgi:hypothetical protein
VRIRVTPNSAAAFEWQTDATRFRVGRGDACALRFQGDAGQTVSWEHAEIVSSADGTASVMDLRSSNGTFVDGTRIVGQTPIRVGSSIQLGRLGPQLILLELNTAGALATERTPSAASVTPAPVARSAAGVGPGDGPATWFIRHAGPIAAGLVILVLGYYVWQRPPSELAPVNNAAVAAPVAPAAHDPVASTGASATPPATASDVETGIKAEPPPADPWKAARDQAQAAFRLIIVEDPKTQAAWPFAGAVVVGDKALLTTAGVATELSKFVSRGWGVAALEPGRQVRVPVSDLRIHAAYGQESADQQLYFDMGILRTDTTVGEPIRMASTTELTGLERGQPLMCLAVDHAGDPLDRFQQLEPAAQMVKVFAVTSLPPQPGGPRLLHLRGSLTDKACGSPVFDQQGRLVAVYCEAAPPAGKESVDLRIYYAKLIEPQLIELAVRGGGDEFWVRPQPSTTASEAKEPTK